MEIVFLSSLFPPSMINHIEQNSIGNIHYAGDALQWHFLNGFIENVIGTVEVINAPLVGSFPLFYKKLFLPATIFNVRGKDHGVSIRYCNLPFIKNTFIKFGLKHELNAAAKRDKECKKIIIVYGMHTAYMKAAIYAKKLYSNSTLCLIVPDLPEYYSNSTGIIWKFRGWLQEDVYKLLPHFDSFVLLTKLMAERLDLKSKPWVEVEGIVNPIDHMRESVRIGHKKKIIMYAGTLASRYNILDLLSAFEEIEGSDYELWLCGAGNTESYIKEKAKTDPRIKYHGLLSRKKVLELQRQATVLVNPRSGEGDYTKYSFPSKTMEYLLSGVPVVMRNLPGIPDEYNEYIHFVKDNSISSLRKKLIEVCSLDPVELFSFGQRAKKFVLENKNYRVQTEKILDMVTKV